MASKVDKHLSQARQAVLQASDHPYVSPQTLHFIFDVAVMTRQPGHWILEQMHRRGRGCTAPALDCSWCHYGGAAGGHLLHGHVCATTPLVDRFTILNAYDALVIGCF
jgi:hypothetical protein